MNLDHHRCKLKLELLVDKHKINSIYLHYTGFEAGTLDEKYLKIWKNKTKTNMLMDIPSEGRENI